MLPEDDGNIQTDRDQISSIGWALHASNNCTTLIGLTWFPGAFLCHGDVFRYNVIWYNRFRYNRIREWEKQESNLIGESGIMCNGQIKNQKNAQKVLSQNRWSVAISSLRRPSKFCKVSSSSTDELALSILLATVLCIGFMRTNSQRLSHIIYIYTGCPTIELIPGPDLDKIRNVKIKKIKCTTLLVQYVKGQPDSSTCDREKGCPKKHTNCGTPYIYMCVCV